MIVAHIINFMLLGFIRSNWRRHPSQVKHVAGWFIQWSQLATTDVLRFIGAWSQNDSIWSLLVERCQCFAVVSKREGSQQIEQAALPSEEMPLLLRSQIHDVSRIDQYLTCIVLCNLYIIIIYNDNDFYASYITYWIYTIHLSELNDSWTHGFLICNVVTYFQTAFSREPRVDG